MLQHLLSLLLSAKSGVLAGVLLIGTTGALVTATVQNGVTTITITQASASPTGSASLTSTATASPTSTATASPSTSPSSPSGAPSACADQAHAMADAIQTVNSAYSKFHTDLEHMRKDSDKGSGKSTIENAGKDLQQIREAAVKAIHATKTCGGTNADEDKDKSENQDEDNDNEDSSNHAQGNVLLVFLTNLLGHTTTTTTTTTSPSPAPTATTSPAPSTAQVTTFTGSDPKAIADEAVAAMKTVFDAAMADLASPSASPNTTHKAIPTARPEKTRRPDPSNKKSGEDHD